MAFEELKAEIAILMESVNGPEPDAHEAYERIKQSLDTLRAEGLPLPEDLVKLEGELDALFDKA